MTIQFHMSFYPTKKQYIYGIFWTNSWLGMGQKKGLRSVPNPLEV